MKKGLWTAAALVLTAAGLAACGEEPAPADIGPKAPDGIAVAGGRLMLPAVKGNPAAIYFEVTNSSADNKMIRAASVEGAGSTMLHASDPAGMQETLQVMVKPGETVKFEPGGLHVMAMDVADTLVAGGSTQVTLTFVGGDQASFPAEVHAPGDER